MSQGPVDENEPASIALVMAPPWQTKMPPLGLAYLDSFLRSKGVETRVIDLNVALFNQAEQDKRYFWDINIINNFTSEEIGEHFFLEFRREMAGFIDEMVSGKETVIGLSTTIASLNVCVRMAHQIKQRNPSKLVILGGPGVFSDTQLIDPERIIDIFVIGEGELPLLEIMRRFRKTGALSGLAGIPGTIVRLGKEYHASVKPDPIKNLDEIPLVDFSGFDLNTYSLYESYRPLPVTISRGCINRCSFCIDHKMNFPFRSRDPQGVLGELKYYVTRLGVRDFEFNDLLCNGDLKQLEEICDLLIQEGLGIRWHSYATIRSGMTPGLLTKMKLAGCHRLCYGMESASDVVLKKMNKPYGAQVAEQVVRDTHKAGISTAINIIIGHPGESEEEFRKTCDFIKRNKPFLDEITNVSTCLLCRGNDLSEDHEKYGIYFKKTFTERIREFFEKEAGPCKPRKFYARPDSSPRSRAMRLRKMLFLIDELKIPRVIVNRIAEDDPDLDTTPQNKMGEICPPERALLPKVDLNFESGTGHFYLKDRKFKRHTGPNTASRAGEERTDIALINLPPWSQENPHIGVGYLGAYLRQKGISLKLFDLNKLFFKDHPERHALWHVGNKNYWSNEKTFSSVLEIFKKDIENAVSEISACGADILGFSVVDPKERLTLEFIKKIKKKTPQKRIILGGPATSTREQRQIFLDHAEKDIDFFVIGEGEETLFCLMDRLLNKKGIEGLQGCYLKKNGGWDYEERPPMLPLDAIPFPTYEEFDMSLYSRSLLVEWSRGCRSRCAFCKNYKLFPFYRTKSSDWVLQELRYHKERYKIEEFTVVDNVLNGDPSALRAICDRIVKEGLRLRWSGQIAPRKDMDLDFFIKMKEAGCFKLQIGLESGSDKVLKMMRKPFTADVSERNIRDAKKAGIETEIFVMVGFPGETEDDFSLTSDFVARNAGSIDAIKSINTLHLIAGTDIYDHAGDFGLKELPREGWHYLWETETGNSYPVRKARAEKLLELADQKHIKVLETNISEGQPQLDLLDRSGHVEKRVEIEKEPVLSAETPQLLQKAGTVKRSIKKWAALFCVSVFVLAYMAYFWLFALIKGRVLLGGQKK